MPAHSGVPTSDGADTVLLADPRVAAVPVVDCGEPLVDLRELCDVLVCDRKAGENPDRALLRRGVAERVREASLLLPAGLRFLVVEAYRPLERQLAYVEAYRGRLRRDNPALSDAELDRLTSRFVSPPAVAPHVSGAAVDLTLVDADGVELDLGTPVDATPEDSAGACYLAAPVLEPAATHRALLAGVLGEVGLVNYPTEWWHWSFGDRYWAVVTGAAHAVYGPVRR